MVKIMIDLFYTVITLLFKYDYYKGILIYNYNSKFLNNKTFVKKFIYIYIYYYYEQFSSEKQL